jgi:hypothetical protein
MRDRWVRLSTRRVVLFIGVAYVAAAAVVAFPAAQAAP